MLSYAVLIILRQAKAQEAWNDEYAANDPRASDMSSGINISTNGIIAMCTIVGVVCIIGSMWDPTTPEVMLTQVVSSTILFLIAKRRQWAMTETIRRSARRLSRVIRPPPSPRLPDMVPPPRMDLMTDDEICYPAFENVLDLEGGFMHEIMTTAIKPIYSAIMRDDCSAEERSFKTRSWGSFFGFRRP